MELFQGGRRYVYNKLITKPIVEAWNHPHSDGRLHVVFENGELFVDRNASLEIRFEAE